MEVLTVPSAVEEVLTVFSLSVALDLLPRRTLEDGTVALSRVERERFLGRILARERRTAPKHPTHAPNGPNLLEPPNGRSSSENGRPRPSFSIRLGELAAQSILPKIMTCFSMSQ